MTWTPYFLVSLGLSALAAAPPPAPGDLKVIANPSVGVSEISVDEIRSIFLGTTTSMKDAGPVHPVLDRGGENLNHFATAFLGKSGAALEIYYRSLMFTGKWSIPVSFSSDAEVVAYVARNKGAIGFVSESATATQVKTLRVK